MIRVSICYPKTEESHFDMAYYLATHMPLCRDRLTEYGLTNISVDKVIANGTPGAAPSLLPSATSPWKVSKGSRPA